MHDWRSSYEKGYTTWSAGRSLTILAIITLAACGTARLVHRDQGGGVIELQGDHGKAMEQANEEMAAQCGPDNFTIMEEGEEATDTDTRAEQATGSSRSRHGSRSAADATTATEQTTRTALRVHYQCGGAAGNN